MPFLALLLFTLTLGTVQPADAASFSERLRAVSRAIEGHLRPEDVQAFPKNQWRVGWTFLAGDKLPDAIAILRRNGNECAGNVDDRLKCKALVLRGQADGSFKVIAEMPLAGHPLVIGRERDGSDTLFVPTDPTGNAPYQKFGFDDAGPVDKTPGYRYTVSQAIEAAQFEVDDRAMPTIELQAYIAQNQDNESARLAPARIVFDGINVSSTAREREYGAAIPTMAATLQRALQPDISLVAARVAWPLPLEVRLWDCVDWMVPRRFWEVEGRRLGRIGVCVDALTFGAGLAGVVSADDVLLAARYRLLQEVGIAYVLRVYRQTAKTRNDWKNGNDAILIQQLGVVAGTMIAHRLGLLTPPQIARAQTTWQAISDAWFRAREREQGYIVKSPELQAFDENLKARADAAACALQFLKLAPVDKRGSACDVRLATMTNFIAGDVAAGLAP